MKMKFLFVLSLFWSLAAVADVDEQQLFEQANEAYESGEFQTAIQYYDSLTEFGQSTALYYNLGNAYFKTNQVAEAILYYERALKLNPNDPDIHYNLQLANERIKDNIEKLPELNIARWWSNFTLSLGVDLWGWLSIGLMIVAMVLMMVFLLAGRRGLRMFGFYTALVLILFSGFSYYQGAQARQMIEANTEAIVLSPRVDVKGAPTNTGINVFVIHEGTKVQVLGEREEWVHIRIASGNEGWILQSDLAII